MKILHINTFQEGGAALCAIRINKALMSQGIESRMFFAHGASLPKGVNGAIADKDRIVRLRSNPLFAKFRHLLMRMPWYMNVEKRQVRLDNVNTHHLFLHIPYSNYTNIVHHPLVEWVDIIHLHWVSDFVDYTTFFKNIKKPIIWTLHDKYPIVGVQGIMRLLWLGIVTMQLIFSWQKMVVHLQKMSYLDLGLLEQVFQAQTHKELQL